MGTSSVFAQVLVGLVNREHLMVVMRRALAAGGARGAQGGDLPEVPYEELNRNYVSAAARSLISEQQLAVLQVTRNAQTLHLRIRNAVLCVWCLVLKMELVPTV